jgi:hypothetical protein
MKTKRLRTYCREFLKSGPKNTRQILDHLNESLHNGTSMHQLGNVLSRDPEIERLDLSGPHRVRMWGLANEKE